MTKGFRQDTDRLLSYNTKQQVLVQDRLLGIIHNVIMLMIVAYIVGYVFIGDKGYLETEPAKGVLLASFSGDAAAHSAVGNSAPRFFSAEEISYPGLSNGNVFVTTKVNVQQEERGVCEDTNKRCMSANDCSPGVGAVCSPEKYCIEPSWCPVGKHEEYKLSTANAHIWIKSSIMFQSLDSHKMFHTDLSNVVQYPQAHHNAYKVTDFLRMSDPPVRFEEVSELGAALEVQFVWNCQVDNGLHPCEKVIQARRVDSLLDQDHIGYGFTHSEYDPTNPDRRTRYKKWGIRFFFSTVGVGSKLSMAMIIFKLSTGIAVLGVAPLLVDVIMCQFLRLSKKYHARKYDYTEDFSSYFEDQMHLGDVADSLKEDLMGEGDEENYDAEADAEDREWRGRYDADEDSWDKYWGVSE